MTAVLQSLACGCGSPRELVPVLLLATLPFLGSLAGRDKEGWGSRLHKLLALAFSCCRRPSVDSIINGNGPGIAGRPWAVSGKLRHESEKPDLADGC
jgi:hypothetical protein